MPMHHFPANPDLNGFGDDGTTLVSFAVAIRLSVAAQ
jgi:hypothetical protein